MRRFLIALLFLSSFNTPVKSDPLINVIKHLIRGGTKEVIRNEPNSKPKFNYASPSKNIFGKYRSSQEAFTACTSWQEKRQANFKKLGIFYCLRDPETNQVIGMHDDIQSNSYQKVLKRFKY